jgi:hypothetical protein
LIYRGPDLLDAVFLFRFHFVGEGLDFLAFTIGDLAALLVEVAGGAEPFGHFGQ